MADLVIQRFVLPMDRAVAASLYYHEGANPDPGHYPDPKPVGRRSIVLGRGSRVDTDTYFNSFFESYWRRHTTLGRLVLRVRVSGTGTLQLWRSSRVNGSLVVGRNDFEGEELCVEMETPPSAVHFRELGTLFFEVIARSESVTIHSAEWVAKDVEANAVRLVAGYCTFNRETYVLNNLEALDSDPDLWNWLTRIVVVDQGTNKVRAHPAYGRLAGRMDSRIALVEQDNFGGSGGFTRCILEAMQVAGATHVLLLDDDAVMEPESVYRASAMLSLAKGDLAIGGPMLDMLQSCRISEAGADLDPIALKVKSWRSWLRADRREHVHRLAKIRYAHYNGWWFFAFPLSAVERLGLPLPLFIKCDDVEYGCRLMRGGIPTLAMPGLGVWHLPFYLKSRGWDEYYGLRNIIIAQAVCFSVPGARVARTLFLELLNRLVACNYFRVWAMCEAIEDYLAGPSVLERAPTPVNERILETWRHLSPRSCARTRCLRMRPADKVPKLRVVRWLRLAKALVRQVVCASPPPDAQPAYVLPNRDENWHGMRSVDVVAIDDRCTEELVVLRRDRGLFLRLLGRGAWAILRLLLTHDRTVRRWKSETRRLTEVAFWRSYLGLTRKESQAGEKTPGQIDEAARIADRDACFKPPFAESPR